MSETIAASAADAVERAAEVLRDGNLVVLPTDTIYAIVGDAFQSYTTRRIFEAKKRGRDVPLSLLIRNPRQVIGLVDDVPETAERLMASYWPGPLTVVLHAQPDMAWDLGDTNGTVALRMPADDLLLALGGDVGPLACSGANRHGEQPPVTLDEARGQLGDSVALYVDDGPRDGARSTIVDCSQGQALVLREGAVPAEHVRQVATGELGWGQRPPAEGGSASPPGGDSPRSDAQADDLPVREP